MDDGLPIVGPAVDLSQTPPINHKRTLAFLNHFITHTVRFLNRFSGVCEEKLAELQGKIQRLEITLSILEAKLSSIPGLDQVSAPTEPTEKESTVPPSTETTDASLKNKSPVQNDDTTMTEPASAPEPETPKMTVSKDPRYMKYFKMVAVGVPPQAVKGKMAAEGLNPDFLDQPDAPSDAAPQPSNDDSDDHFSSDDASSFSEDD